MRSIVFLLALVTADLPCTLERNGWPYVILARKLNAIIADVQRVMENANSVDRLIVWTRNPFFKQIIADRMQCEPESTFSEKLIEELEIAGRSLLSR